MYLWVKNFIQASYGLHKNSRGRMRINDYATCPAGLNWLFVFARVLVVFVPLDFLSESGCCWVLVVLFVRVNVYSLGSGLFKLKFGFLAVHVSAQQDTVIEFRFKDLYLYSTHFWGFWEQVVLVMMWEDFSICCWPIKSSYTTDARMPETWGYDSDDAEEAI